MTDLTDEYLCALQDALLSGEQADMDGCRVKVSRQACEEAAAVITALRQREAEAVAGSIEAAAMVAIRRKSDGTATLDHPYDNGYLSACDVCATAIRALHTDATRAALDRLRAEGMREALEIAHRMASTSANMNRTWRAGCEDVAEAIHRAADKLEGKS